MGTRWTTRCCSAVALTIVVTSPAVSKPDPKQPSLFPLTTVWTLPLNAALTAPPAYQGTRAFFPIEGGRIVAYDLALGTQMWMAAVPTAIEPAASPDLLFVVQADRLVALRIADGSPAWQRPLAETLAAPPVWDNGWLVVATIDGSVLAFRDVDGSSIWRASVGSPAHARPALAADRVYVPTEDGRVVALRVDTGAPIWEHRLGGAASDILALGDRLYVGSRDNFFYCLNTQDGEKEWRWPTGGDVIGRPLVDERNVYFVSLDNVLRALRRTNGNQAWKSALPLRPTSGPLKAAQAILVTGFSQKLPAYRAEDGKPAGDISTSGEIAAPLHAVSVPAGFGPTIILITRDIVKGAAVAGLTRSIEPPIAPFQALPNPVPVTPAVGFASSSSPHAAASRRMPSSMRSIDGAENESRARLPRRPSTKNALPAT